jgi:Fe-S cluster biogenesis protein NfuA/nitrite reductase/ring-hydroxylating ferredoxin subunit
MAAVADPELLVARVQELTADIERLADPAVRATADELVSVVVQMYGAGLERIMETIAAAGDGGKEIEQALVADGLVASLLLIHDLYPIPLEDRVVQALERVRPYMESHGGNVELIGIENGVARLRLEGSCKTCAASSATLELAVRQALEEAAPDLEGMDVEGVAAEAGEIAGTPLPMAGTTTRAWFDVDGVASLAADGLKAVKVGGTPLVIGNVEGTLLAYRNTCVGCGGPLDGGVLSAGALKCPTCRRSFFLPRAGRSLDDDQLQLEPVPLLRENGAVRVALAQ